MSVLTYPSDLDDRRSDFVEFVHFPYRVNDSLNGLTGTSFRSENAPRSGARIRLYMPNTVPATEQIQEWKSQTFPGPRGQALKRALDQAGDLLGNPAGDQGVGQQSSNVTGAGNQMLLDFLASQVNMDANTALALGRGVVYNPNVELLYKQPTLRKFSLDFNFIPKSQQDTRVVDEIISEFKFWSSPDVEKENFLTIPHLWLVTYHNASKGTFSRMNPWRPAALEAVVVQDNPLSDLHSTIEDPEGDVPVHTKLMMSFVETDIITRKDHREAKKMGYKRGY